MYCHNNMLSIPWHPLFHPCLFVFVILSSAVYLDQKSKGVQRSDSHTWFVCAGLAVLWVASVPPALDPPWLNWHRVEHSEHQAQPCWGCRPKADFRQRRWGKRRLNDVCLRHSRSHLRYSRFKSKIKTISFSINYKALLWVSTLFWQKPFQTSQCSISENRSETLVSTMTTTWILLYYGYNNVNITKVLEVQYSAIQCLPGGSDWSLFSNDASDFLLVSGLEAQLELEWKCFPLEKTCPTHWHVKSLHNSLFYVIDWILAFGCSATHQICQIWCVECVQFCFDSTHYRVWVPTMSVGCQVTVPAMCCVCLDNNNGLTFRKLWFYSKLDGDFQPLGHVPNLSHQFVIVLICIGKIST